MEFGPQSTTLTIDARSLSGVADVLAREPPADEVNGFEVVFSDFSHIFVSLHMGPVFFKYLAAERVNLDLPRTLHSGAFEAKVESADSRKERAKRQHSIVGL